MTQFRVLPIRRGDAYLLKSKRGNYLVDGGAYGCGLPKMLQDRKTRKLRAAICSCCCPERLGGILELLESDFHATEYWLPESLGVLIETARRFNGDWNGWLDTMNNKRENQPSPDHQRLWPDRAHPLSENHSQRYMEAATALIGLALTACLGHSPYGTPSRNAFFGGATTPDQGMEHHFCITLATLFDRISSGGQKGQAPMNHFIKKMGWELFFGHEPEDLALLCGRLLHAKSDQMPGGSARSTRSTVRALSMAAMTATLLSKTSARLRFFRHTKRKEDNLIARNPLKCINGIEVSPLSDLEPITTPKMLALQTQKMAARKNGLVFQYGDAKCGVLFCGDTRMNFLEKTERISLDRPTVIAAPRQGSSAADRAYDFIHSQHPTLDVWVRSHFSNARKISVYFKKRPNKICLNNCRNLTLQEILLQFTDSRWNRISGDDCACG